MSRRRGAAAINLTQCDGSRTMPIQKLGTASIRIEKERVR